MDTDSLYFALSDSKHEDVVRPELKAEFDNCKKDWLAWDTFSNRTQACSSSSLKDTGQ